MSEHFQVRLSAQLLRPLSVNKTKQKGIGDVLSVISSQLLIIHQYGCGDCREINSAYH